MISTNTLVLIGLRTWESTPKNCDIIEVYSHDDIKVLGQIPSIHIDHLIRMANGFSGTGGGGGGGGDSSSSIAVEDIVDFINSSCLPVTMIILFAPNSLDVSIIRTNIGLPLNKCKTFGIIERIRFPSPAANMVIVSILCISPFIFILFGSQIDDFFL